MASDPLGTSELAVPSSLASGPASPVAPSLVAPPSAMVASLPASAVGPATHGGWLVSQQVELSQAGAASPALRAIASDNATAVFRETRLGLGGVGGAASCPPCPPWLKWLPDRSRDRDPAE